MLMAFNSTLAIPLRRGSESYLSILLSRAELEGFHDYDELVNSGKKIDFQINQDHYLIQSSLVKNNQFAMYSGLVNNHNVFIKVFAKEDDYLTELDVLRQSGTEELLDSCNQKFPLLVLKHTDGKMLSQIIRDFFLWRHFEINPQDEELVDKLWPNYEQVSNDEFKSLCAAYTDSDYIFRIGDQVMIHEELYPDKVLVTPNLKLKAYDYTKLKLIPDGKMEKKLLKLKIQEGLVDSLNHFITGIKGQILEDIKNTKIPVEILLDPDFESSSLIDSSDAAFPPLKSDKRNDLVSQDLHLNGFEKHQRRKSKSLRNKGSLTRDFSDRFLTDDLSWGLSSSEDHNLHAGSTSNAFKMDDVAQKLPQKGSEKPNWLFNFFSPGKQSEKNDWRIEEEDSDEENGITIMDADYFPELPDQNFNRQLYDSEHNPSTSALTESFYSAISDHHSAVIPSQRSSLPRKHRSADSLVSKASHKHHFLDGLSIQGGISRLSSASPPPELRLAIH